MNHMKKIMLVLFGAALIFCNYTFSADFINIDPTEKKSSKEKEIILLDPTEKKSTKEKEIAPLDPTEKKSSKEKEVAPLDPTEKKVTKDKVPLEPVKQKDAGPIDMDKKAKSADSPVLIDKDSKKTDSPVLIDKESPKKLAEKVETTNTANKGKVVPKPTGNMTEEKFIELLANMQILAAKYNVEKNPKAMEKVGVEMDLISKKLEVNNLDFNDYSKKVQKDPKLYERIMQRVAAKVQEMQRFEK